MTNSARRRSNLYARMMAAIILPDMGGALVKCAAVVLFTTS